MVSAVVTRNKNMFIKNQVVCCCYFHLEGQDAEKKWFIAISTKVICWVNSTVHKLYHFDRLQLLPREMELSRKAEKNQNSAGIQQ